MSGYCRWTGTGMVPSAPEGLKPGGAPQHTRTSREIHAKGGTGSTDSWQPDAVLCASTMTPPYLTLNL